MKNISKVGLVSLLLALHACCAGLFAQEASPRTQEMRSLNGRYVVHVTGMSYEGFVGDQTVSLMNANGDTLWSQVVPDRFLIVPWVSDEGDVAITRREIRIFDSQMRLKGSHPFQEYESPYNVVDYEGTVQGFSPGGDRYFIFTTSGREWPGVTLLCLSDSAKELWSKRLGAFKPSEILFYADKLIADDRGFGGIDYDNGCYVIDMDSNVLWKYTAIRKGNGWTVDLDSRDGILNIEDGAVQTRVELDKLSVRRCRN